MPSPFENRVYSKCEELPPFARRSDKQSPFPEKSQLHVVSHFCLLFFVMDEGEGFEQDKDIL